jgi:hypothetical protein
MEKIMRQGSDKIRRDKFRGMFYSVEAKLEGYLMSAAGFEPATHALKKRANSGPPRIFNNLQS